MSNLTDVYCTYTGGGIYVITARCNDVWLMTDIEDYGTYDTPWEHITDNLDCDYDSHWKDSAFPLPTWAELLNAVKESYDQGISDNMDPYEVEDIFNEYHSNLNTRINDK